MDEWNAERATTSPSRWVTVMHAGAPSSSARSMVLWRLPCTYTHSPMRAMAVGRTRGAPAATKPTWHTSASSMIACTVSRSYAARFGLRRTRLRSVGA